MQGFEHGEDPPQDEPLELSFDDGVSPAAESAPESAPESVPTAPEPRGGAGRPAENARVISPGEAFQDDWTGGEGAGDFLELDGELGQSFGFQEPGQTQAQAAPTELELAGEAPPEPAPGGAGLMGVPQDDLLEPEFSSGLVPSEDPAEYEAEDEYDEYEDELEAVPAAPSSTRGLALKICAGFAVGLAMAVGMNSVDFESFFGGEPLELVPAGTVAEGPGSQPGGNPAGGGLPVGSGAGPVVPTGTTQTGQGPADLVSAEGPPGGLVAQFVSSIPAPAMMPQSGMGTSLAGTDGVPTAGPEFLEPFEPTGGSEGVAALGNPEVPGGGAQLPDGVEQAGVSTSLQPAGEIVLAGTPSEVLAMLDGVTHIFQGSSVPMDRIASPVQIMTPSVGLVRAELEGGDVFEGRLYSVGTGRVWIDTQMGRMGLRAESLHSVERITEAGAEIANQELGSLSGKQVRALTMGGRFVYGTLLRTRDGRATLRTEAGGRITVDEAGLELVGDHPTVRIK